MAETKHNPAVNPNTNPEEVRQAEIRFREWWKEFGPVWRAEMDTFNKNNRDWQAKCPKNRYLTY